MKDRLLRIWRVFERAIQSISIQIGLFFLYVIGVGLTRLLMSLFFRRYLQIYKNDPEAESYWKPAENYEADEVRLLKQV